MPFDPTVAEMLTTAAIGNINQGVALTTMVDRNLSQGLGVVNTALIQAQGSVSDDPGLIAALQTASRAPVQGANDSIK